uniref:Cystatin n=1 Tax=Rhipicephalus appendiculatus TaxID=34631 RepID=A0A131Y952_RHIAP
MRACRFANHDMAAGDASALLIVVLLSFFKQSFEARGWTEDRNPNRFVNRVLARYAYENQRHSAGPEFTFLVTQARRKIVGGNLINLGFIVYRGLMMVEKCITTIFTPPPRTPGRAVVTRFWCRKSV